MFEDIENVNLIFSSKKSRMKRIVKNREGHVLIFRKSGCGIHKFENETIKSLPGNVLFIPEGISYSFEPLEKTPCTSISLTFSANIKNPEPTLFDGTSFPDLQNIFLNIHKYFHLNTSYAKNMSISLLYSVFAYLSEMENSSYYDKSKDEIIKPAIDYIEAHLCDSDLKTTMLHKYCSISPAYFRRIFKASTKMTPQKYIEEKRMERALFILNENSHTISEISEMVGYNDPLYFGSVFKKKYGISPFNMRKLGHP